MQANSRLNNSSCSLCGVAVYLGLLRMRRSHRSLDAVLDDSDFDFARLPLLLVTSTEAAVTLLGSLQGLLPQLQLLHWAALICAVQDPVDLS